MAIDLIDPSQCVRCKTPDSAEGFYVIGRMHEPNKAQKRRHGFKVGICRAHKAHAGGRITWTRRLTPVGTSAQ